jgi:nucleoside-diphosphate-sugar epimerase
MHHQILLTGATGALGPALAAELVASRAAERVAILMRAPAQKVDQQFAEWLTAVRPLLGEQGSDPSEISRLHPVAGDICDENLGLGIRGETLQRETDCIIHAAADTNFAAPQDRQWAVNVGGTQRTLDWASNCRNLKRYLLVSSVFVSGSRTGRIDETIAPEPPEFATYYQRTKWESERAALASSLPLGIARISMVLGSHANGSVHRVGAVHSLIKWFARGLVPMVPGDRAATGDIIATELAARCLARAVVTDWGNSKSPIWHIAAAEHAPRMTEMIDFVYDHFASRPNWRRKHIPRPPMVDQQEFDRYTDSVEAEGRGMMSQALRSINRFLPDLFFPKTYKTTQAEALWGGPLPQYDWRETMERVCRFCCPLTK